MSILGRVFRPASKKKRRHDQTPTSHVVEYSVVVDSHENVVDEVLAVPMLSPKSYTHEDVVEIQYHGNEVCLHRILRACLDAGARIAEPALSFFSFNVLQESFSFLVKSLRAQCIELLTDIEARLDFEDEMSPLGLNLVLDKLHGMLQEVENALETANYDKLLQSEL